MKIRPNSSFILAFFCLVVVLVLFVRRYRELHQPTVTSSTRANPSVKSNKVSTTLPPNRGKSSPELAGLAFDDLIEMLRKARLEGDDSAAKATIDEILSRGPSNLKKLVALLEQDPRLRTDIATILAEMRSADSILPLMDALARNNRRFRGTTDASLLVVLQQVLTRLAPYTTLDHAETLRTLLFSGVEVGVYCRNIAFRLLLGIDGVDSRDLIYRVFRGIEIEAQDKNGLVNGEAYTFYEDVVRAIIDLEKDQAIPELMNAYLGVTGKDANIAKGRILVGIADFYPYQECVPMLLDLARQYGGEKTEGFLFSRAIRSKLDDPGCLLDLSQRLESERHPIAQLALVDALNESEDGRAGDSLFRFFMRERSPDSSLARENALIAVSRITKNSPVDGYQLVMPMITDVVNNPSQYNDFVRMASAGAMGNVWHKSDDHQAEFTTALLGLYPQTRDENARIAIVEVLGDYCTLPFALDYLNKARTAALAEPQSSSDLLTAMDKTISEINKRLSRK